MYIRASSARVICVDVHHKLGRCNSAASVALNTNTVQDPFACTLDG